MTPSSADPFDQLDPLASQIGTGGTSVTSLHSSKEAGEEAGPREAEIRPDAQSELTQRYVEKLSEVKEIPQDEEPAEVEGCMSYPDSLSQVEQSKGEVDLNSKAEKPRVAEKPGIGKKPPLAQKPHVALKPSLANKPSPAEQPPLAENPPLVNKPTPAEKPLLAEKPPLAEKPSIARAAQDESSSQVKTNCNVNTTSVSDPDCQVAISSLVEVPVEASSLVEVPVEASSPLETSIPLGLLDVQLPEFPPVSPGEFATTASESHVSKDTTRDTTKDTTRDTTRDTSNDTGAVCDSSDESDISDGEIDKKKLLFLSQPVVSESDSEDGNSGLNVELGRGLKMDSGNSTELKSSKLPDIPANGHHSEGGERPLNGNSNRSDTGQHVLLSAQKLTEDGIAEIQRNGISLTPEFVWKEITGKYLLGNGFPFQTKNWQFWTINNFVKSRILVKSVCLCIMYIYI